MSLLRLPELPQLLPLGDTTDNYPNLNAFYDDYSSRNVMLHSKWFQDKPSNQFSLSKPTNITSFQPLPPPHSPLVDTLSVDKPDLCKCWQTAQLTICYSTYRTSMPAPNHIPSVLFVGTIACITVIFMSERLFDCISRRVSSLNTSAIAWLQFVELSVVSII